jgi:glycosyltransferase involved in cell wall biosynthesis
VSQPACSIVIRSFNEERHIGRLLTGILAQSVREVEILLVDSGSTDDTLAVAAHFPVRVLRIEPQEFTFGRSLNLGCAAATRELIVIASAHVYPVYPDWLELLLAPFSDRSVGLTYGKQRGAETSHYSERQVFQAWFPETERREQSHPFCNNANAAIRRELWLQHRYDEGLSGLEDVEWAAWAMQQGHKLVYEPAAEVIHVHSESAREIYNRYRREAMALRRIRPQERIGLMDAARLFVSNAATDAWHAGHDGRVLRELPGILRFRFLQFWGSYQGWRMAGALTSQLKQTFYYPRGLSRTPGAASNRAKPIGYEATRRAKPPAAGGG